MGSKDTGGWLMHTLFPVRAAQVDIDALRELAWNGIPHDLRPVCWRLLLGYQPPAKWVLGRWGPAKQGGNVADLGVMIPLVQLSQGYGEHTPCADHLHSLLPWCAAGPARPTRWPASVQSTKRWSRSTMTCPPLSCQRMSRRRCARWDGHTRASCAAGCCRPAKGSCT